jgi:hypothetical protein
MLNVIMISAALAVTSLTLGLGIWALNKLGIDPKKALSGGLTIVILATVVVASSFIMKAYNPMGVSTIINMLLFSVGLAISAVVMGIAAMIINKVVGIKDAIMGGLTILILCGVIVAASQILAFGDYKKYPSLDWALGVGASLLGFGLAAGALGAIAMTGIGALAIGAGVLIMLGMAASIVEIDNILSSGSFKKYPPVAWAEGVGASFVAISKSVGEGLFGNVMGDLLGSGSIDLANQMVQISNILSQGNFTKYPPVAWADGVGKALKSIGGVLGDSSMGDIFGNILANATNTGPVDMAKSMVDMDKVLSAGSFAKYPPVAWADGVLSSVTKFMKVKDMLGDSDTTDINTAVQNIRIIMLKLAGLSLEMGKYTKIPAVASGGLDTITNMANAYDRLANSLTNLSASLNNLQQNQLDGLKMLTGNIISLSVIDPENFDKIMEIVKTRSNDLKELFNNVTGQVQASQVQSNSSTSASSTSTVNSVSTTPSSTGKTINDVYDEIVKSNKLLTNISSSMGSVSNFLNDMRITDIGIKHGTV